MSARRGDALAVFALALGARLGVVAWAGDRFPASADGAYYQRLAERIAAGFGSTWLWPDGAVTYAAHYPVGWPALLALAYRVAGSSVVVAGVVHALLGALAAPAAHRLALRAAPNAPRRVAALAGVLVALHPALVAYTPAVMTEGVTASLLVLAAWLAARARERPGLARLAALGAMLGAATLVRPQSIALAPLLGALAVPASASGLERLRAAVVASALAALVCVPWTARNCVRMHRCALVSVNGGWNLLIGSAEGATGAWSPVEVPPACATVWDEAAKDACFGDAARREIAAHPARFAALVPRKLATTFDYAGAAGWYLHEANPAAFSARAKLVLGAVETAFVRLAWLAASVAAARLAGPRRKLRGIVAALAALCFVTEHAWWGVALLVVALVALGRALARAPVLATATVATVVVTALTHAAFFGAGRYGLVVLPLATALAALAFDARRGAAAPLLTGSPETAILEVREGAGERCP